MENSNEELNSLQRANEQKKKKLTDEHGAYFGSMSEDIDLPPEIQSQFLDNIMAYEDAWKNAKRITVYDFLGNPIYRKLEELNDTEVTEELERLMNYMNEHQISLVTLCDVDDRKLYRFITEELFLEEKDDVHIPGMMSCYTYEEFHPNHEYDIRNHSYDFMQSYLNKESDFYTTFMTSEAEKMDWHIHFREAFSSFLLCKFEISELEFDVEKAKVQFDCEFTGQVEGSNNSFQFLGNGTMTLLYKWDFWSVDKVNLPQGVVI